MYNDAKKASNERYLSKFRTLVVRVKPEEAEQISTAASEEGLSVHAYMLGAVRDKLENKKAQAEEGYELVKLPAGHVDLAKASAAADGKDLGPWLCKAVDKQTEADARERRMAADLELQNLMKAIAVERMSFAELLKARS